MSPKHTPGPWHTVVILDESSILKAFDGKTRSMLIDLCARVPYRSKDAAPTETHNARLIAAAPELLDALKVLLSLHDSQVDTADAWNVSMEEARTAISKATGEPA